MDKSELIGRCREFTERHGLTLGEELGAGAQGIVFSAKSQDEEGRLAIKIHKQEPDYFRKRDAYFRLRAQRITTIRGCNVPELIAYDDDLWVIVMTVVERPFVLDFGGAFLDQPPDFPENVLAEWEQEKLDKFGPQWPEVRAIMNELQGYGIFLIDVNPGNISFTD